jgi:hypothetical protein
MALSLVQWKPLTTYCGVEQLVARWAHNPKVVGSSPTPATKKQSESEERERKTHTLFFFELQAKRSHTLSFYLFTAVTILPSCYCLCTEVCKEIVNRDVHITDASLFHSICNGSHTYAVGMDLGGTATGD